MTKLHNNRKFNCSVFKWGSFAILALLAAAVGGGLIHLPNPGEFAGISGGLLMPLLLGLTAVEISNLPPAQRAAAILDLQREAARAGASRGIEAGNADPRSVLGQMAGICAKQSAAASHDDRRKLAREFAAIYAAEFRGQNAGRMFDAPLSAADYTDAVGSLNTLSGSLVTQRTLELLKFAFPALIRFTTDFSDMPAQYGQTVITRTVTVPSVQTYSAGSGWTAATAATTDKSVAINKHVGVPITFDSNTLGATVRALFAEFAPASAYALAKDLVDALYANITDSNFGAVTAETVATSAFARSSVISLGTKLTLAGNPYFARTLLLYPTVFAQLAQDTSLVTFAAFQKADLFTRETVGGTAFAFDVHGFAVHETPNLPTNDGNVTGFAGTKSALIIATRIPNDYTTVLPGAAFGNMSIVTDPDTGISVSQVQYVDHQKGSATSRLSLMYGTAAGQGAAGCLVKAHSSTGSSRTS